MKIIAKTRGNNVVVQKMAQIVADKIGEDSPFLMLTGTQPDVGEEMEQLVYQKTGKKPSFVADVGCAVSINSGPKMIDLTSFCFLNSFYNVRSYSTSFWRWHQASWTENFTKTTNNTHHVRASDDNVEVHPATLDFLHVLFSTSVISASSQSSVNFVAFAEYHYANSFTGTVWQYNCTTNLLFSMTGVNTQSYMD